MINPQTVAAETIINIAIIFFIPINNIFYIYDLLSVNVSTCLH
ncbi:hypothetical protein MCHI_002432 [Candidatus Magnetoovum chiemensis]|nr:hypothetical protein MCHI_002432 [Candidatus Magnetoovum chiemensis]